MAHALSSLKYRIFEKIARFGFVRPFSLYSMAAWFLRDQEVKGVVDGGAYDGKHAYYLSKLFPKALIFAFEPLPAKFDELAAISVRNSRIIPINKALSDSVGDGTLNCNALDSTSSFLNTSNDPDCRGFAIRPRFYRFPQTGIDNHA